MKRSLYHDDVVFLSPAADFSSYVKYGATVVASGGIHSSDYINKLKQQGLHVAARSGASPPRATTSMQIQTLPPLPRATSRANPLQSPG